MTVPTRSGDYVCAGCGEVVPGSEAGTIWCRTPLGMGVLKVHKTQTCGKAALANNPQHKMYRGNRPPGWTEEDEARRRT